MKYQIRLCLVLEPGTLASTVTERNMMIVLVVSGTIDVEATSDAADNTVYQGLVNIGAYSALILTQN